MDQKGTLVYEHEFGTRVSHDTLVFGKEFRGEELGPNDLMEAFLSDDYRYLIVQIDRGVPAKRVDIVYRDLTKPGSYFQILGLGHRLAILRRLREGRVVREHRLQIAQLENPEGDPGVMPEAWTTIVPEAADAIDSFNIVGDKIYVNRLHDVKSETKIYTLDGQSGRQS
ncbi:MAG: hypothetical protein WDM87_05890 [Terracidiphilus sp.]